MSEAAKIIITTATVECRMCPTTVTGRTTDECTVYARYRWGQLSVRLDPRHPAPHGGASGTLILERQIDPEGLGGCMTYEELMQHTADTVVWPPRLTPRLHDEADIIDL